MSKWPLFFLPVMFFYKIKLMLVNLSNLSVFIINSVDFLNFGKPFTLMINYRNLSNPLNLI